MGICISCAGEAEYLFYEIDEAVLLNNVKLVRKTLADMNRRQYVDASEVTKAKSRGLFTAVEMNNTRMIKVLLAEGARATARTSDGNNCLHLAVSTDKINLVKMFLRDVNINETNWSGNTPLYMAIDLDNVKIVQLLLKNGANPNTLNLNGGSPLYLAIKRDRYRLVKLLLDHGTNPNLRDFDGATIFLRVICIDYKFDLLDLLLEYDANVNLKCNKGYNVLHWIVTHGSHDLCERILQNDVNFNINVPTDTDGKTALHLATYYRDSLDLVYLLVESGADLNAVEKEDKTALYYAASKNRMDMVEYLVDEGADVNCRAGSEPVLVAAANGYHEIVRYLINHGANINARNKSGETLLCIVLRSVDLERSKPHSPQLQLKLPDGVKNNLQSTMGESPIRRNVDRYREMMKVAEVMIHRGADVNFVDRQGNSLLSIVIANNQTHMIKLLFDNGYQYAEMSEPDKDMGKLYLDSIKLLLNNGASAALDCLTALKILSIVVCQRDRQMMLDLLHNAVDVNSMYDDAVLMKYAKSCNNEEVCDVLIKHCAILSARNARIHEKNLQMIASNSLFRKFYEMYRKELSRMKQTLICPDYDVTYFDVLHKRTSQVLVCVCSKAVRKKFEAGVHKKKFEHYWEYLNYSYLNWLRRFDLIYESSEVLFKFFRYVLSHDVILAIVEYLSNRDLSNILLLQFTLLKSPY